MIKVTGTVGRTTKCNIFNNHLHLLVTVEAHVRQSSDPESFRGSLLIFTIVAIVLFAFGQLFNLDKTG